MEIYTKENGEKARNMVKDVTNGPMGVHTPVHISMVKEKAMVNTNTQLELFIKANGSKG